MAKKTIQQILNEQKKLSKIHQKSEQQIAVTIANTGRKVSESSRKKNSESNRKFREENPLTAKQKKQIGDAMRGKTLEELIGTEAAERGRAARREANYKADYTGRGEKIAATRRARGSYDVGPMTGKKHKQSTKEIMAIKAQIRQDLRRKLNLGKEGKLSKELLEAEYKKRGLK